MAYNSRTEHSGIKRDHRNPREKVKLQSRHLRRMKDKDAVEEQIASMENCSDNRESIYCDTCPHFFYCDAAEVAESLY